MKRSERKSVPRKKPPEYDVRNTQIGWLLKRKRRDLEKSASECAKHIVTSRQRYAAIEAGKSAIHLVELEALMKLLFIEPNEIWSDWGKEKEVEGQSQIKKLQVQAGQSLTIVVEGLDRSR